MTARRSSEWICAGTAVLTRMRSAGQKLETARISNNPAELRRVAARAGVSPRIVVEAT
jgi:hypothetical protein